MNFDNPADRATLAASVSTAEYNRRIREHFAKSSVATVNGYSIRPMGTRFGRLFIVHGTKRAFATLAQAEAYASTLECAG